MRRVRLRTGTGSAAGGEPGDPAAARAAFVRDYLVETGQIAPERLFLVEAGEPEKATSGPRTLLTLQ